MTTEEVIDWLRTLPQPVRACYEAGPTGFALYCAADAAGVPVGVVAPSKTPASTATCETCSPGSAPSCCP